jgi:hypothetical protein
MVIIIIIIIMLPNQAIASTAAWYGAYKVQVRCLAAVNVTASDLQLSHVDAWARRVCAAIAGRCCSSWLQHTFKQHVTGAALTYNYLAAAHHREGLPATSRACMCSRNMFQENNVHQMAQQ